MKETVLISGVNQKFKKELKKSRYETDPYLSNAKCIDRLTREWMEELTVINFILNDS